MTTPGPTKPDLDTRKKVCTLALDLLKRFDLVAAQLECANRSHQHGLMPDGGYGDPAGLCFDVATEYYRLRAEYLDDQQPEKDDK